MPPYLFPYGEPMPQRCPSRVRQRRQPHDKRRKKPRTEAADHPRVLPEPKPMRRRQRQWLEQQEQPHGYRSSIRFPSSSMIRCCLPVCTALLWALMDAVGRWCTVWYCCHPPNWFLTCMRYLSAAMAGSWSRSRDRSSAFICMPMDQTELILPHAASQSGSLGAALSNWKVSYEHSWGTSHPT